MATIHNDSDNEDEKHLTDSLSKMLLHDSDTAPKSDLITYIQSHVITTIIENKKNVKHNYLYVDDKGNHQILYITNEEKDQFFRLLQDYIEEHEINLSERVDSMSFPMFFELSWSISAFHKNDAFTLRKQLAKKFFCDKRDVFLRVLEGVIEEINPNHKLDTSVIVQSRTCYHYHIIFPNIITNSSTMKIFYIKLLKKLNETNEEFFDWKQVLGNNNVTYNNGYLLMPGCTKQISVKSPLSNEPASHHSIFSNADTYQSFFSEHDSDRKIDSHFISQSSIQCAENAKCNFELLSSSEANNNVNNHVEEMFKAHTGKLIQKQVRQAIYDINSTGKVCSGTIIRVDPHVVEWKKFKENSSEGKPCFNAILKRQVCPFKGSQHVRATPSLYCMIFEKSVILRCYDCTAGDPAACCKTPLRAEADEVDFLMQQELANNALVNQTHESLASVIFNWVKDRVAASESAARGKGAGYIWHYFRPESHIWVRSDKRIVDDVMTCDGLVQSKFREVTNSLIQTYEESKDDNAGNKKKALLECMNKLFSKLQNHAILGTVIPLIARKVAAYYQDKDTARRPFIDQLDEKPYLLATMDGVLDFRKKVFRDGRPDDLISKNTGKSYTPWEQLDSASKTETYNYFRELFPVEEEHHAALRIFSRMLNGELRVQGMYFCLGKGGDGKSVLFCRVLKGMLGELCKDGQPATITGCEEGNGSAPRADLIHMKYCRLFNFTEAQEKDPLNLGRFKQLTGGEKVPAAPKFGEQEEIELQATFTVIGNYKMRIEASGTDDGTWRRILYILFRRRYRQHQWQFTGEEYECWAKHPHEMTLFVERLQLSVLSYLVHIYNITSDLPEPPEPAAWAKLRNDTREENDIWLKYINTMTRKSKPEEKGLTVKELWDPFYSWLKGRGNARRASNIDKFEEYITAHLREPIVLDPKFPNEKGWKRQFLVEVRNNHFVEQER